MLLRSTKDSDFLNLVRVWLDSSGEAFVVIRRSHSAGAKDYLFVDSFVHFESLISSLPAMADVIVFRRRQLPIRGVADAALLERCLLEIPDGEEFLLLNLEPDSLETLSATGGESHAELESEFQEFMGKFVAVGRVPRFWEDDNEEMQSALAACADGSLKRGIY
jgi:hypothetical protein